VTVLLLVMITGMLVIVALVVMVYLREPAISLPDSMTMPEGETSVAVTATPEWTAVIGRDAEGTHRLHILDPETGTVTRTISID